MHRVNGLDFESSGSESILKVMEPIKVMGRGVVKLLLEARCMHDED
jgi:hypothetical protein